MLTFSSPCRRWLGHAGPGRVAGCSTLSASRGGLAITSSEQGAGLVTITTWAVTGPARNGINQAEGRKQILECQWGIKGLMAEESVYSHQNSVSIRSPMCFCQKGMTLGWKGHLGAGKADRKEAWYAVEGSCCAVRGEGRDRCGPPSPRQCVSFHACVCKRARVATSP